MNLRVHLLSMGKEESGIKCIAIDDEPLALDLIESYIKKVPYLSFAGGFSDPMKALGILKSGQIDLIFLDINMPDLSGIDFVKGLEHIPRIVFITAYDSFAVQGFELNAIDYLLKPVAFNRFLLAAGRAQAAIKADTREKELLPKQDYIFVKSEHNVLKISLPDISYIEGYKDYVKIYTDDTKPVLTINTIKALEEMLPADNFIRIHKSYIISIGKIRSFRNGKVLLGNKHLPIGDSYRDTFMERVVDGRI